MATNKRKVLSLQDKRKILQVHDETSHIKNQTELSAELQISVSTLRAILRDRHEIEEQCKSEGEKRKKMEVGQFEKLEKVLAQWLYQARAINLPISNTILCENAHKIAKSLHITDFNALNGWIDCFKNRHSIICRDVSEESETADEQNIDTWMAKLPALLENYDARDIFNADKCSLYFNSMPEKMYGFDRKIYNGNNASKERLSVLACTNSDGTEKLRLLVVGKTKNTSYFKNLRSLPVTYATQPLGDITISNFTDWLKSIDEYFQKKNRNIILFFDNRVAHPKDVSLKNIKLVFLPPNAPRTLQPMNQGIIKELKQGYRTQLAYSYEKEINRSGDKGPLNLHAAILNIAAAWGAIKADTIKDCFKKAGFLKHIDNVQERELSAHNIRGYSSINDNVNSSVNGSLVDLAEDADSTQKASLSDEDDDEDESAQALSAVDVLRHYLSSLNDSGNALQMLNFIENLVITNASLSK